MFWTDEAESIKDSGLASESHELGFWDPSPNPQWGITGIGAKGEELGDDLGYFSFHGGPGDCCC